MKLRVLIDFDGPIHKYSKGFHDGTLYDEPTSGAKEFIDGLKDDYEIVIFTARTSSEDRSDITRSGLAQWLNHHNIHFDKITSEKTPAIAYIDDRAIEFKGAWDDEVMQKFKALDDNAKKEFNVDSWKDINSIEELFNNK